jgi:hypothetical protein
MDTIQSRLIPLTAAQARHVGGGDTTTTTTSNGTVIETTEETTILAAIGGFLGISLTPPGKLISMGLRG